jgi:class 3 adenylate cyclase
MQPSSASDLRSSASLRAAPAAADADVALLCVDVVGFTKMTERLGDHRSLAVMLRLASLVSKQTTRFEGFELEVRGDSYLLVFDTTKDAVRCAIEIQRALERRTVSDSEESVRVRISVHAGKVLRKGDGYFGRNLILSFRVLSVTGADEIAITAAARNRLPRGWSIPTGSERTFRPKGFGEEVAFRLIDWSDKGLPCAGRALSLGAPSSEAAQGASA